MTSAVPTQHNTRTQQPRRDLPVQRGAQLHGKANARRRSRPRRDAPVRWPTRRAWAWAGVRMAARTSAPNLFVPVLFRRAAVTAVAWLLRSSCSPLKKLCACGFYPKRLLMAACFSALCSAPAGCYRPRWACVVWTWLGVS